jgi:hypothetical protein
MPTGIVTASCVVTGLPTGSETIAPPGVTLTAAIGETVPFSLIIGDNTLTLPAGTTYAVLAFPITTAVVTRKGDPADVGVIILNAPSAALFSWELVQGATVIILNATVAVTGCGVSFI